MEEEQRINQRETELLSKMAREFSSAANMKNVEPPDCLTKRGYKSRNGLYARLIFVLARYSKNCEKATMTQLMEGYYTVFRQPVQLMRISLFFREYLKPLGFIEVTGEGRGATYRFRGELFIQPNLETRLSKFNISDPTGLAKDIGCGTVYMSIGMKLHIDPINIIVSEMNDYDLSKKTGAWDRVYEASITGSWKNE